MHVKKLSLISASLRLCGLIFLLAIATAAQTVPAPKDVLGWTPGDDRKLASWAQVLEYFKKLDAASDRVQFQEIGKTTMGAPFVYATITSSENMKNLEKLKQINAKLADPRTIKSNDAEAKKLIDKGKTIVAITCGIHSSEVGGYLTSMLIAYRLASADDPETKKILDNTIVLLVPSLNPDGVDIINNWYQKTLGTKFEGTDPPELYHKYVGHDDNRDWYAFTQVESQMTVDKILNPWHPQIVHDIHQQGANGSRIFLPPYMEPVEPNVPKPIVQGYTELGNYIAADLRKQGFQGITTDSTYDAWTPSRAYSHYHGAVRILSETASVRLATPITVTFEQLRPGEHYDPRAEAPNFGPVWRGGEWHIGDITRYMTTAAFSLLNNAAAEREKWLSRFYGIEKDAVRPRRTGETYAYLIDDTAGGNEDVLIGALRRGGVEVKTAAQITVNGKTRAFEGNGKFLISLDQPYASFAKALIEPQKYPDLLDEKGNPTPPYDVTAHSFALLTGSKFEKVDSPYTWKPLSSGYGNGSGNGCGGIKRASVGLYKSYVPSMDEGWSRWVFENYKQMRGLYCEEPYRTVLNRDLTGGGIQDFKTIVFPDQQANQMLNGYPKTAMPEEVTGGIGKEGVENLKKFVESGGTLVFLNRASNFAIEQFGLPIKDVTRGLARRDFYIPGSILRTELKMTSTITKGMPSESIAWFENGPAFDYILSNDSPPRVVVGNNAPNEGAAVPPGNMEIRMIATYPNDPSKILLSGWALGAEKIAGKGAIVEVKIGKGKIILFGFRPQYRGQSLATFPLLFNAIGN